jgi:DNA-binding HxlR family transcriptional regulator
MFDSLAMKTGYGEFCPIAKAAEVFATRWTPLVLRELRLAQQLPVWLQLHRQLGRDYLPFGRPASRRD